MKNTIISLVFLLCNIAIYAQNLETNPHNLSAGGTGNYTATNESQVCIFCHINHSAAPHGPLWNRNNSGSNYTLYSSSTIQATTGQPDGTSILCLSCHDGTIALGNLYRKGNNIKMTKKKRFGGTKRDDDHSSDYISGRTNLTTDLSDDHPVSFIYSSALSAQDGQLKDPTSLTQISLDHNGKVQCTTCHDPHRNVHKKFLRASNAYSALCTQCHDMNYWETAIHQSSTATWNGSGNSPWNHIEQPYTSVAENACANCHSTHSAEGKQRLLKSKREEDNCLDCHNGNVAKTNIQAEIVKFYKHDVTKYQSIHQPTEAILVTNKHVECVDCHNPHAANGTKADAPYANGSLAGVSGIDLLGNSVEQIQYEYELCFRCHSDNPVSASPVARTFDTNNLRLDFEPTNISFHPIVEARNNPSVKSLISPYTQSSIIYCSDCHASNGDDAPAGPHGSIYPQILKAKLNRNLSKNNVLPEGTNLNLEFELCAQCHLLSGPVGSQSVENSHSTMGGGHILRKTACTTCHDPHGFQGGNVMNNSFLINLDKKEISPNTLGQMAIQINGDGSGECNLKCHSHNHNSSKW